MAIPRTRSERAKRIRAVRQRFGRVSDRRLLMLAEVLRKQGEFGQWEWAVGSGPSLFGRLSSVIPCELDSLERCCSKRSSPLPTAHSPHCPLPTAHSPLPLFNHFAGFSSEFTCACTVVTIFSSTDSAQRLGRP